MNFPKPTRNESKPSFKKKRKVPIWKNSKQKMRSSMKFQNKKVFSSMKEKKIGLSRMNSEVAGFIKRPRDSFHIRPPNFKEITDSDNEESMSSMSDKSLKEKQSQRKSKLKSKSPDLGFLSSKIRFTGLQPVKLSKARFQSYDS